MHMGPTCQLERCRRRPLSSGPMRPRRGGLAISEEHAARSPRSEAAHRHRGTDHRERGEEMGSEMAALEVWSVRGRLRSRLVGVRQHCCSVVELFDVVMPVLASPSSVMRATAWWGELDQAAVYLKNASMDLSDVISNLEAAEHLAFTGRSHPAALPPLGVGSFRTFEIFARSAMDSIHTRLPVARPLAEDALSLVESCRGHLWAAALLTYNPGGVPGGVDDSVKAQRLAAVGDLQAAQQKAAELAALVAEINNTAAYITPFATWLA